MTADYFASVAARAVHPERGIQPRRTTIFDAPSAAPGAGSLRQPPADAGTHDGAFALDESVRPAPGALGLGRAMRSRSTASVVDDTGDGPRADARRGQQPDESSAEVSRGDRPALAGPAPPLQPLTGRVATSTPALDTRPDRGRHVIDVVASVRRASASNAAEGGTRRGDEREAVVRVHIGRVDVRAVVQAPSSAAVPRASKPDLMSLDEYVRQRRERRP